LLYRVRWYTAGIIKSTKPIEAIKMERVTKKTLEVQIHWLNKQFNRDPEAVGRFQLDCAYGGYRLVKLCNDSGAQSDISPRGTARETLAFIRAFSDGAAFFEREVA
jgi:hypothetical protein